MHQPVPQIRAGTTVHRNSTIVEDDSQQNSIYQRERSTNRVINAWRETLHLLLQKHTKDDPTVNFPRERTDRRRTGDTAGTAGNTRHGHQRTTKNTAVIPHLLVLFTEANTNKTPSQFPESRHAAIRFGRMRAQPPTAAMPSNAITTSGTASPSNSRRRRNTCTLR